MGRQEDESLVWPLTERDTELAQIAAARGGLR